MAACDDAAVPGPDPAAAPIRPVFVLSLPRSGSTLLQRVLAAHPSGATTSEPWILLPLLSAARPGGTYASYDHRRSVKGVQDLIAALDGGQAAFDEELRTFVTRLYRRAAGPHATFFVDKTPRYHLVIEDVLRTFPDAGAVFLWRNPLAVLASILDTWLDGRWLPSLHAVDLHDGLANLVAAAERHAQRAVAVRYEDLVAHPEATARRVADDLGIGWDPAMVASFAAVELRGRLGDRWGAERYRDVSAAPLERWRGSLRGPVRTAWCRRWLRWIGAERLALMGYELEALLADLDALEHAPPAQVARDVADAARGVAHVLVEPAVLRGKRGFLRDPRSVHPHT